MDKVCFFAVDQTVDAAVAREEEGDLSVLVHIARRAVHPRTTLERVARVALHRLVRRGQIGQAERLAVCRVLYREGDRPVDLVIGFCKVGEEDQRDLVKHRQVVDPDPAVTLEP